MPIYHIYPHAPGLQNGSSWRHAFHRLPRDPVTGAEYRVAFGLFRKFLRVLFALFCIALCCGATGPIPRKSIDYPPYRPPKLAERRMVTLKILTGTKKPPYLPTNCIVSWNYSGATNGLVFKLRGTNRLDVPKALWPVLTNVPGNLRSVRRLCNQPVQFYTLTASNYLGESPYATTQ